jgi:Novel STAND NTPase 1
MTGTTEARIPSLAALRDAHAELVRAVSKEGGAQAQRDKILAFLEAGAAAGRAIDAPADREAAQALLDYWKATLYTSTRDTLRKGETGEVGDSAARLPPGLLAEFDEKSALAGVDTAEQAVQAMPREDRQLAQRLLLQLVRFDPLRDRFVPAPATREELRSAGDAVAVDRVLAALSQAGAVRTSPAAGGGESVELTSEALLGRWPRLSGWLEQRRRLRDAARFWDKSRRKPGAVLTGTALKDAAQFPNLDPLERDFVDASLRRSDMWYRGAFLVAGAMLLVTLGLLVLVAILWNKEQSARKAAESAEDATKKALERVTEEQGFTKKALEQKEEAEKKEEQSRRNELATARYLAEAPWITQQRSIERSNAENGWGLWAPGAVLRVRFLGGSPDLRQRVRQLAEQWIAGTSIKFEWLPEGPAGALLEPPNPPPGGLTQLPLGRRWPEPSVSALAGPWLPIACTALLLEDPGRSPLASPEAEIRISFNDNLGVWSYRGTDAFFVPRSQATMNLGGLADATPARFNNVVLWCFGLALGMVSELNNPDAANSVDWETYRDTYVQVVSELAGLKTPEARKEVEQQATRRCQPFPKDKLPWYRKFNRSSVMMPPPWAIRPLRLEGIGQKMRTIPLRDGESLVLAGDVESLPPVDKSFVRNLYPPLVSRNAEPEVKGPHKVMLTAFRQVHRVRFVVDQEAGPYVQIYLQFNPPLPCRVTIRDVEHTDKEVGSLFINQKERWARYYLKPGGAYYLDIMSLDWQPQAKSEATISLSAWKAPEKD